MPLIAVVGAGLYDKDDTDSTAILVYDELFLYVKASGFVYY
jgi:hypothetical protein